MGSLMQRHAYPGADKQGGKYEKGQRQISFISTLCWIKLDPFKTRLLST